MQKNYHITLKFKKQLNKAFTYYLILKIPNVVAYIWVHQRHESWFTPHLPAPSNMSLYRNHSSRKSHKHTDVQTLGFILNKWSDCMFSKMNEGVRGRTSDIRVDVKCRRNTERAQRIKAVIKLHQLHNTFILSTPPPLSDQVHRWAAYKNKLYVTERRQETLCSFFLWVHKQGRRKKTATVRSTEPGSLS